MSFDKPITKENLHEYLKELSKIFRKLNGTAIPAEIILIGGASILINYGFRSITYDMDAIITASSAMKEAIIQVRDKYDLPYGWLNTDFRRTKSYTEKLYQFSVYYKTYSNILTIRTIAAEYLVAMKLMSGRQYKYDLSDVAGILWEHKMNETPITREMIDKAVSDLYDGWSEVPEISKAFLDNTFKDDDYEKTYFDVRESEKEAKQILVDFQEVHPDKMKGENINEIIESARRKMKKDT